jgi:hypothetical protein
MDPSPSDVDPILTHIPGRQPETEFPSSKLTRRAADYLHKHGVAEMDDAQINSGGKELHKRPMVLAEFAVVGAGAIGSYIVQQLLL